MGWDTGRVNERRRANVTFAQVCLMGEEVKRGWAAFRVVEGVLARTGVRSDQVFYLRHTTTPVGVTTIFEVRRRP
jgi:hypothetical protein